MVLTGGCNCRAIRYQIIAEPLFVHVCHCRECQHDSGGAFNMTMLVLEADFEITHGKARQVRVRRKSGKQYFSHFCEDCGNPLYGMPVDSTGVMVIRPGSLDGTDFLQPQAHIWVKEKQPWLRLPADIPQFATYYDPAKTWPTASLERLSQINRFL
jgi:hypothetical protein